MFEILLALISNMKMSSILLSVICGIGMLFLTAVIMVAKAEEEKNHIIMAITDVRRYLTIIFIPAFILAITPTIDDLWKVRIGLIKYELADKENVKKATEVIERIGKKLECKYLGCKEQK